MSGTEPTEYHHPTHLSLQERDALEAYARRFQVMRPHDEEAKQLRMPHELPGTEPEQGRD